MLKAIERAMKATKHVVRSTIPRWWLHLSLLMQLTVKKDILNIQPRQTRGKHRPQKKCEKWSYGLQEQKVSL